MRRMVPRLRCGASGTDCGLSCTALLCHGLYGTDVALRTAVPGAVERDLSYAHPRARAPVPRCPRRRVSGSKFSKRLRFLVSDLKVLTKTAFLSSYVAAGTDVATVAVPLDASVHSTLARVVLSRCYAAPGRGGYLKRLCSLLEEVVGAGGGGGGEGGGGGGGGGGKGAEEVEVRVLTLLRVLLKAEGGAEVRSITLSLYAMLLSICYALSGTGIWRAALR
eukprot:755054-Rhodomonas_salina.2